MTVNEALISSEFTTRQKIIIRWQFKIYGKFFNGLMDLIVSADMDNRAQLALAFPEYVLAYEEWMRGENYCEDLDDI
ncbi:MAG: hypothetical protein H0X49_03365 [Acidobacteria bacterium]|nr:hypothetical protein [Acidobacteriota bacterium]